AVAARPLVASADPAALPLVAPGPALTLRPVSVRASSAANSCTVDGAGGHACGGALLVDQRPDTAWCEGVPGAGVGQGVELVFDRHVRFLRAQVKNGYWKGGAASAAWSRNGRATWLRFRSNNGEVVCATGGLPGVECDLAGITGDRVIIEILG